MKIRQNEKIINKYIDYTKFIKDEMLNISSEKRYLDLVNFYNSLDLKENEKIEIKNFFYSMMVFPASWIPLLTTDNIFNIINLNYKTTIEKVEYLSNKVPFETNFPEIAKKAHYDGTLWNFDSLWDGDIDYRNNNTQYIATNNGRLQILLYSGDNILQLKDLESGKIWEWSDDWREFKKYGTYISIN